MAKSIYPNQFTVVSGPRPKKDSEHLYTRVSVDALQQVCNDLNGVALKLYLYLVKNKEDFTLGLSPTAAKAWGIKKDSYYNAKDELIEKGYLVEKGNSIYEFMELPNHVEANASTMQPQVCYDKDKLESIRDMELRQVVGNVVWLEDDVVQLPTGVVRRVLPF